jgi:lipoprotein-releasing system permease protein
VRSSERLSLALRYTFPSGRGHLTTFLSSLSMLGLVLAITLLIVVLSVMNGFDKEMRERILSLVPHISVYSHLPLEDYQTELDTLREHPEVTDVIPFVRFDSLLMRGRSIETAQGVGIEIGQENKYLKLLQSLSPGTIGQFESSANSIVLGASIARRMGVEPGESVTLVVPSDGKADRSSGARFQTVQVVDTLQTGTELDEHMVLVSLSLASELAGLNGGVSGFRVETNNIFSVQRIGWELTDELPPGYYSTNWMMTHGNLYSAIQLSRDLVSILLLSIIAVAAFNVVSSLVLVVMDKQGNIAILRTLGASSRDVAWIYILQGSLIGVVGAVVGSILGVLASTSVPGLVRWLESLFNLQFLNTDVYPVSFVPVDIRFGDIALIGVVAWVMCVLAAIYPARRAARLAPAVILNQDH